MRLNTDLRDFAFRALFCLIFLRLGAEHIFDDALIQKLLPSWVPLKRAVSIGCGLWLFDWGSLVLLGWHIRKAAVALGAFLVLVTLSAHLPRS